MKKTIVLLLLLAITLILASCSSESANSQAVQKEQPGMSESITYQDLSHEEANNMMNQYKGIMLVDVRTPQEHQEVRIPGSLLLPLDELENEAEELLTDKEAKIFVYCRSGRRSAAAAKILVELGYKNVYNIGGINNWPYATEEGSK